MFKCVLWYILVKFISSFGFWWQRDVKSPLYGCYWIQWMWPRVCARVLQNSRAVDESRAVGPILFNWAVSLHQVSRWHWNKSSPTWLTMHTSNTQTTRGQQCHAWAQHFQTSKRQWFTAAEALCIFSWGTESERKGPVVTADVTTCFCSTEIKKIISKSYDCILCEL